MPVKNQDSKKSINSQQTSRNVQKEIIVKRPNMVGVSERNIYQQKTAKFESSRGSFVVRHREFVQDVYGTGPAFVVKQFSINPGLSILFPWLSTIATRFQKYRFRSLRFLYKPSAPSTTQGFVFLVPDYDSADVTPSTKSQALQYESAMRGNVWDQFTLNCKNKDLNALPQYYVRGGTIPNTDIKTYDVGQLFVALVGPGADSGPMGELHVEYEIELISPYISSLNYSTQDIFISCLAYQDIGFGLSRTVKSDNIQFHFSDSGRLMVFDQGFNGMLFVYGVGTGSTIPTLSGATTDGNFQILINAVNGNSFFMWAYLQMQPASYLALDGWCGAAPESVNINYSFAQSLQKLWN